MESVEVLYEPRRGCGFRVPGGMYIIGGGFSWEACCLLPNEVSCCAACGAGIKPARGWTWVKPQAILASPYCQIEEFREQARERFPQALTCPARFLAQGLDPSTGHPLEGRVGLLWIGEQHYATPSAFTLEARRMGISRRLTQIPRDFQVGRDWVLLGHRKAAGEPPDYQPAIFMLWKPHEIQCVLKPTDTAETVKALRKRGIVPVIVERFEGQDISSRTYRVVPA